MDTCTGCEQHISALLDGEAEVEEILFVLDHLPTCPSCQSFLHASRGLQTAVASLRAAAPVPAITPARQAARMVRPRTFSPRWVQAMAAGIVFALGLWAGGSPWLGRRTQPQTTAPLTEERLVAFARTLLDAEPRYRQSLLALLLEVQSDGAVFDAEARPDEDTPATLIGTSLDFASTDVPAEALPR